MTTSSLGLLHCKTGEFHYQFETLVQNSNWLLFLFREFSVLRLCCYSHQGTVMWHHQRFLERFWSGTEQGWPHWGCWTALLLGASQIRSHAGVYQWGWGAPNAGCEWKCAQGSCEKPNELEQVWVIQICHACPLDNGASLLYQCTVASNIHLVEDLHVWHLLLCVRNSIKWKSPQGQAFLRSLWHVACRHLCAGNLCCLWGCLLSQGLHLMGSTAGKLCIPPTSTVLSAGWNGVIFWALNHDFWMEVMFCSGIWNVLHLLLTLA